MTCRTEPNKIVRTISPPALAQASEAQVKQCRKCQIMKPTTEFYRETKGSRGREGRFRAICKSCWLGHEPEVTNDERKAARLGSLAAAGRDHHPVFHPRNQPPIPQDHDGFGRAGSFRLDTEQETRGSKATGWRRHVHFRTIT